MHFLIVKWTDEHTDDKCRSITQLSSIVLSCSAMSNSLWPPGTVACQVPLSMGCSQQEYWSGSPLKTCLVDAMAIWAPGRLYSGQVSISSNHLKESFNQRFKNLSQWLVEDEWELHVLQFYALIYTHGFSDTMVSGFQFLLCKELDVKETRLYLFLFFSNLGHFWVSNMCYSKLFWNEVAHLEICFLLLWFWLLILKKIVRPILLVKMFPIYEILTWEFLNNKFCKIPATHVVDQSSKNFIFCSVQPLFLLTASICWTAGANLGHFT